MPRLRCLSLKTRSERLASRPQALEQVAGNISPETLNSAGTMQATLEDQPVPAGLFGGGVFATRADGRVVAEVPLTRSRGGLDDANRVTHVPVLRESQAFVQGVLDSVPSQIAVIDRAGRIVAINSAWRRFSLENSASPGTMAPNTDVGANYLDVCASAESADDAGATFDPRRREAPGHVRVTTLAGRRIDAMPLQPFSAAAARAERR